MINVILSKMAQKGKLIHIRLFSSNGRFDFKLQSNSKLQSKHFTTTSIYFFQRPSVASKSKPLLKAAKAKAEIVQLKSM